MTPSRPSPADRARVRPELAPLLVPIDSLVEDPDNARIHPEENVQAIRSSLESFGQVLPIVVRRSDGKVLAGNGRLAVMRALGWKFAAAVRVDDSDALAAAYSRTDNRTAELAGWDDARLAAALASLDDAGRAASGFSGKRLDDLLARASGVVESPREHAPPRKPGHVCPGCGHSWY